MRYKIWYVGHSLAASLEPLTRRRNVDDFSVFYRYYFGRCLSELAQLVPLPFSVWRSTRYLIDCMISVSPFLDVIRISMPTLSFLTQVDSRILCP